jgi:hypothetical protein
MGRRTDLEMVAKIKKKKKKNALPLAEMRHQTHPDPPVFTAETVTNSDGGTSPTY